MPTPILLGLIWLSQPPHLWLSTDKISILSSDVIRDPEANAIVDLSQQDAQLDPQDLKESQEALVPMELLANQEMQERPESIRSNKTFLKNVSNAR